MNAETDIRGDSLLVISFSENVSTIPTKLKLRGLQIKARPCGENMKVEEERIF